MAQTSGTPADSCRPGLVRDTPTWLRLRTRASTARPSRCDAFRSAVFCTMHDQYRAGAAARPVIRSLLTLRVPQVLRGAPKRRHQKSGKIGSVTLKAQMHKPLSPEHEKQVRLACLTLSSSPPHDCSRTPRLALRTPAMVNSCRPRRA